MEIWFNPDEKIIEISGNFFTFMGNNTISDISNIDPLWSLSSHYIKEEKFTLILNFNTILYNTYHIKL